MGVARVVAFVAAVLVTPAHAAFLNNKSDWDQLSPDLKFGYVMGVADRSTAKYIGMDAQNMYVGDLSQCIADLGMDSDSMVEIVDNEYRDLSRWEYSPDTVLTLGLRKVCLNHMNRARAERGDPILNP